MKTDITTDERLITASHSVNLARNDLLGLCGAGDQLLGLMVIDLCGQLAVIHSRIEQIRNALASNGVRA
jgi:hypothetical protein